MTQNDPLTNKSGQIKFVLPVNRKEEEKPVGMAKDFNFQMLVIYFIFKLTICVASTTTANFESVRQLQGWVNTIFHKIRKSVNL